LTYLFQRFLRVWLVRNDAGTVEYHFQTDLLVFRLVVIFLPDLNTAIRHSFNPYRHIRYDKLAIGLFEHEICHASTWKTAVESWHRDLGICCVECTFDGAEKALAYPALGHWVLSKDAHVGYGEIERPRDAG
jgi:hypothetical protein